MLKETKFIWMDGKMIPWGEAKVHVLTHSLHYGLGVFEGIRCYKGDQGPAIFKLREHIERLFNSAHITRMKIPFSQKEIVDATVETIKVNELEEGYIRP
ncbi:MAG: aminotransferase class IV, partial [Nitrospirae bacterium]|nr:aminotransferase class IV [Nitrospirota bacterium]